LNQSIVQQFAREGKFLIRSRRAPPIGLMARMICK